MQRAAFSCKDEEHLIELLAIPQAAGYLACMFFWPESLSAIKNEILEIGPYSSGFIFTASSISTKTPSFA
jgi:hypothetical protein